MSCRSLNLLFIWWTPVIPQGSVSFCPLSFYSGSSRGPQVLPCLPELSGAVSVWCLPSSPVVSQSWSGRFGHLCARGGARGRTASRHNPHQSQRSPHTGTQAHSTRHTGLPDKPAATKCQPRLEELPARLCCGCSRHQMVSLFPIRCDCLY